MAEVLCGIKRGKGCTVARGILTACLLSGSLPYKGKVPNGVLGLCMSISLRLHYVVMNTGADPGGGGGVWTGCLVTPLRV